MTDSPKSRAQHKPRPKNRGQKPMIWIAGIGLLTLAVVNDALLPGEHGPLWRVLAAILAFLYLWWMSSLLFDLVFVWHRYIQGDAAHKFLRAHVQRADLSPKGDPPDDRPSAGPTTDLVPPTPVGAAPAQPRRWAAASAAQAAASDEHETSVGV